jgi:hypothetical protein
MHRGEGGCTGGGRGDARGSCASPLGTPLMSSLVGIGMLSGFSLVKGMLKKNLFSSSGISTLFVRTLPALVFSSLIIVCFLSLIYVPAIFDYFLLGLLASSLSIFICIPYLFAHSFSASMYIWSASAEHVAFISFQQCSGSRSARICYF